MSIDLKNVSYIYDPDLKDARYALDHVTMTVEKGKFYALIGHTGSGKSTLVQMLNGLLLPTEGEVLYEGRNIREKDFSLKDLRTNVGLVFQYPEHQLFEADVFTDVCFGPKNMGLPEDEIRQRAEKAMVQAGLDESYYEKSPFELSGGEKRRAAIAGVLAMEPQYLVLDEPTAGLDPEGRRAILSQIRKLNLEEGITIVLVTHSMEDAAEFADEVFVMDHGRLVMQGTPKAVFKEADSLGEIGLGIPEVTKIARSLRKKGVMVPDDIMTVEEAKNAILKLIKK